MKLPLIALLIMLCYSTTHTMNVMVSLEHALLQASKSGDIKLIVELIDEKTETGLNLNARDNFGDTALMRAAEKGYLHIVQALIASGADVNAQSTWSSWAALFCAAHAGHQDIAKALIAAGAHVNITLSHTHNTPLMEAAHQSQTKVLKVLIASGAHVNAKDAYNDTALLKACYQGNVHIVQALINAHADIHAKDATGRSPLIRAASCGHTHIVRVLLAAGASINETLFGYTPLMHAAKEDYGHPHTVQALIAAGADINTQDNEGNTAFMIAAHKGHTRVAYSLIAAGAHYDEHAPHYARYTAFKERVEQLFDYSKTLFTRLSDNNYAINHPVEIARVRALHNLVKTHGLRLDFIDPHGNTLLHKAILSGNRVMIGLLVHLIVKYNQCDALEYTNKKEGQTPVQMAVTKSSGWLLKPFFQTTA